jgi:hypothetical protein
MKMFNIPNFIAEAQKQRALHNGQNVKVSLNKTTFNNFWELLNCGICISLEGHSPTLCGFNVSIDNSINDNTIVYTIDKIPVGTFTDLFIEI